VVSLVGNHIKQRLLIMGKIKDGNISGVVGNLVFAGNTVRQRPVRRQAWSESQVQQRCRMSAVVEFYRSMKYYTDKIWSLKIVEGLTPYNRFIKLNMPAFDKSGHVADTRKLCLIDGVLDNPFNLSLVSRDGNKIKIKWECDELENSPRLNDTLSLILFNGEFVYDDMDTEISRKDNGGEIDLPLTKGSESDTIFVYFVNMRKAKYSPSIAIKL
jgi:hypothetical protein